MRRIATLLLVMALIFRAPLTIAQSPSASESWDAKLRALADPAVIKETARRLSARPHHLGSPYDKDNADWLLAQFKAFGWDAELETFDVLFPTPKERLVEMVAPTRYRAKLEEPPMADDPTSGQKPEQLPTYNAYSVDGDVTGPLVYVNYGRPVDYEVLERLGISVKGAVVLARYGQSWRGIKPKVAAEHGAVGCLIYSDPRDDGYSVADVFPKGPMRNADGVQRGSVMDMPVHAGDPLTPGVGAKPDARRLDLTDAVTLTKIPVLPISYGDAQPLLEAIEGRVVPPDWRGGLPITYHIGPGPARVRLKVAASWNTVRVYNVIARIEGSTYPGEWIIRGNHHDAWVNGAEDPVSGMAAELEEARAIGALVKQGWRPKRTIIYAAWDGEEQGLLGSTEWVEQHAEELQRHAVVYINSDSNQRGFLDAGGSHSLEKFVNAVARDVEDPEAHVSVWKRLQARTIDRGSPDERAEARTRADLRLHALGSGSDYTPFLQHLGVPTLSLSFGGLDTNGIYHSIYDSFYHYTRFHDPDFTYGRTLAQTIGTAVVRLADADLLPFEFTNVADTVRVYLKDLQALLKTRQDEVRDRNLRIEEGVFAAIDDPRRPLVPPKPETVPPALNFAPLENAATALADAAERYRKAVESARASLAARPEVVTRVNARLIQSERQLTDAAGLKNRQWFRHLLYAPGFYTGYAVKTVPGVRESIEQKWYSESDGEIARAAAAIDRLTALVAAAARDLETP
jgi:N-acetylated-alpha-linked acidic dipeptidase